MSTDTKHQASQGSIGSLAEYNRRFFPERVKRESEAQRLKKDPGSVLAEEFLTSVRKQLQAK